MNGEQQDLVLSTSGGFWACAYSLYMRIALDYPEIIDYGSANLPESYQMDFFWRDTLAISTNLGFALELLLKLLLYRDSGKVSKTHSLGRVYAGMSPELKKVMANVYRDTLKMKGDMILTYIYAASPNQIKKFPKQDKLYRIPKQPRPKKLDTLKKLLYFIDRENLLYGKRYEAFSFDHNKWYPFFDRLIPLFEFVRRLSRVIKSSDDEWEYYEVQEPDNEKSPLIFRPFSI